MFGYIYMYMYKHTTNPSVGLIINVPADLQINEIE